MTGFQLLYYLLRSSSRTSLVLACSTGHEDVVSLLLANRADVDSRTKDGRTALHVAAHQGYKNIVQVLLENKATVNVADEDGITPLHVAADQGHKDVVERLLAYKADASKLTGNGRTALALAVAAHHDDTAALLRTFSVPSQSAGGSGTKVSGDAGEEGDWKRAVLQGSPEAFRDFLRRHPSTSRIRAVDIVIDGAFGLIPLESGAPGKHWQTKELEEARRYIPSGRIALPIAVGFEVSATGSNASIWPLTIPRAAALGLRKTKESRDDSGKLVGLEAPPDSVTAKALCIEDEGALRIVDIEKQGTRLAV